MQNKMKKAMQNTRKKTFVKGERQNSEFLDVFKNLKSKKGF